MVRLLDHLFRQGVGRALPKADTPECSEVGDGVDGRAPPAPGLFVSPRSVLSTPRSVLSTPRSLLSTPRSLITAHRERQAARNAARQELFQQVGASIRRHELRQLSRSQLRQRLRDLGAADTEGDGMLFGVLVDTVLLWNALGKLHDCDVWCTEQAEALEVLTRGGLSTDLLHRVLLVVGVPFEEVRGLGHNAAAAMVHDRLLQLRPVPAEGSDDACLRVAAECSETVVVVDGLPDKHCWLRVLEASDDGLVDGESTPHAGDTPGDPTVPPSVANGLTREAKFEALEADLAGFLESMDVPTTLSPAAPPAGKGMGAPPKSSAAALFAGECPVRGGKFEALDADLADCLDRQVAEARPFGEAQVPLNDRGPHRGLPVVFEGTQDTNGTPPVFDTAIDAFLKTSARKKTPR